MVNKRFSSLWKLINRTRSRAAFLLTATVLAAAVPAAAGAPGWMRAAAQESLPTYPEDTDAVILLDEQVTTIKKNGDIETRYRRVYKILRPPGRSYGTVVVHFDEETSLTYLKAWGIPAQGKDYTVKEKDAVETSGFDVTLYADTRYKILSIPGAEPGNVVGYEYRQKRRPYILQAKWYFQRSVPVRRARFVLELPKGWEFKDVWINYPTQEPQTAGQNRLVWELENLPAVESEPAMPPWRAVAGWLALNYYPTRAALGGKSHGTWRDVGRWYARLSTGRNQVDAEIQQKVAELTAGATTTLDKIQALAAFAQRQVRYVAIEIGIGGYQPHLASAIFSNRYGDCKDKATLLSAMLREIGVQSHYVLIHTERGVVAPEFPSVTNFNHAILAIRLPADVPTTKLYAVMEHDQLGRLLFFDPTSRFHPLGYLPSSEQANYGLLVTDDGGELTKLPLLAPTTNRLLRLAKLNLTSTGELSGEVQEIRWGRPAVTRRAQLLEASGPERQKILEDFLTNFLGGFSLQSSQVENLADYDGNLVTRYRFVAQNYAKKAGNLLLFRPRVLGQKRTDLLEIMERKYPVEFATATLQSDVFEIKLPAGYEVDELPPPVELDYGFAEYSSKVELEGDLLRYSRDYEIKKVIVPVEQLDELKKFFRRVAADERNSAVLKRSGS